MNIVQLRTNEDVSEEDQDEFFSTLKEQTDQLIYVSRDIDGKFSFGHTPLDSRDLALMSWHLHRVIDMLIQHAGSNDED